MLVKVHFDAFSRHRQTCPIKSTGDDNAFNRGTVRKPTSQVFGKLRKITVINILPTFLKNQKGPVIIVFRHKVGVANKPGVLVVHWKPANVSAIVNVDAESGLTVALDGQEHF